MQLYNENDITNILKTGSLTGRELEERLGISYEQRDLVTYLWALCTSSKLILTKRVSQRYLRINEWNGELSLSPSIPREFSDFTAISLYQEGLERKADEIKERAKRVSHYKKSLAERFADEGVRAVKPNLEQYLCFLLGGDAAYGMSHDVPREASNGEFVKGSDIDIVILHSGNEYQDLIVKLDDDLLFHKLMFLREPIREEIDYITKGLDAVEAQAKMDTPKKAVACKVLAESIVTYGNPELYARAMQLLEQKGVPKKLEMMADEAFRLRQKFESSLLEKFGFTV